MSNLAVNLNLAFMKRNVALLASLLIGFVGFAQIELTPFAGYMMSGKVFIDTQEDYELWLLEQLTFAEISPSENLSTATVVADGN